MKWLLLLAVCLAGCTQSTPANEEAAIEPEPVVSTPRFATLIDDEFQVAANACTPNNPEDLLFEFPIANGTVQMWANFTRIAEPEGIFATNIRMYEPGANEGSPTKQSAWSLEGEMKFHFLNPEAGDWTVRLLHCDIPIGEHVVQARVRAET